MKNMRYLKIYSTRCPQECDRDIILNFPAGLQLPLGELRCLHWLKFPLKELPPDFDPKNLVDLKLPYSKIEKVWESDKVCIQLTHFHFSCIGTTSSTFVLFASWLSSRQQLVR